MIFFLPSDVVLGQLDKRVSDGVARSFAYSRFTILNAGTLLCRCRGEGWFTPLLRLQRQAVKKELC